MNKKQKISDLENNLENLTNLQTNFDRIVSKIRNVQSEKKQIENKHLKTSDTFKVLKEDYANLEKENNKSRIALKTMRKESKESTIRNEKIVKGFEETIEDLLAYKEVKTSEEKALQNKRKKLEKKLENAVKRDSEKEVEKVNIDLNDNEQQPEQPEGADLKDNL